MKFNVERQALADAVAWVARSLPQRPPMPVLSGILLSVDSDALTVSSFDYEVSTQMRVDATTETAGKTLVSASTLDKSFEKASSNVESAQKVGALLAERAKGSNISAVVFDRGGHLYHGKVKALADAAREAGLQF